MSLEKTLQKIQSEIRELKVDLDLFFEDSIQPSVNDCEQLQQRLNALQEHLAVYKYHKQNYELSPSFNLHAKISEKEPVAEEKPVIKPEPEIKKPLVAEEPASIREQIAPQHRPEKSASPKSYPKLSININDKFRFINELFAQNGSEYDIAMEQLNNLHNWPDTEIYLNSLRNLYSWSESKDIVKHFYAIAKKRFD